MTILDDMFTGLPALLPEGVEEFVQGSVQDAELVDRLVARADTVFHLAVRNITVSTSDPRKDMLVNIGGTLNVLLAARDHGIRRVVYVSSASVYGNAKSYCESDPPMPLFPYAVSKICAEHYSTMFHALWNTPVTILRYSNVYGPGQSPTNPYCGVIAKFFAACMAGHAVRIYGDGTQTRDYTYIDDTVAATLAAAQSPHTVGQCYNVGTGIETSVVDLAATIQDITDSPRSVEHVAMRDIDVIERRALDTRKLREAIGWTPGASLHAGLAATYEWLRQSQ